MLSTLGPSMDNGVGATGVTSAAAWLTGTLLSTGGSAAAVWVYYGTNDGGQTASAWVTNLSLGVNASAVPPARGYSALAAGLKDAAAYAYRLAEA